MIPPCLTLSNIRYVSRVKWSNTGKGVTPSPTPRCSSYRKENLDYGRHLYFYIIIQIIMIIHYHNTIDRRYGPLLCTLLEFILKRTWFSLKPKTCGVVANIPDFHIVVNEIELQSRICVHFLSYTLGKGAQHCS